MVTHLVSFGIYSRAQRRFDFKKKNYNECSTFYVCLFVYLLRAARRHTWVLMGSDSNKKARLKEPICWPVVYGYIDRNRSLKVKGKRQKRKTSHGHSQQIKLSNFTVSAFGLREGPYPISTATKMLVSGKYFLQINLFIW